MSTTLFTGGDTHDLHDLAAAELAPHRLRVRDTRHSVAGWFVRHARGDVSVYDLGYGAEVDVVPGELGDFYAVQIPMAGNQLVSVDGRPLSTPFSIAGPGQHVAMSWSWNNINRVLVIARQAMDQAVTVRRGDPRRAAIRFDPTLDRRSPRMAAWLDLARTYTTTAASGLFTHSPLARHHHEQLLVHGLLDIQPHDLPLTPAAAVAAPKTVRRAAAFCAEHAHEPISVADIARAAGASLPSLRAGFRTHLNTTPLAYLRRVRLDRAHHDLLAVARGDSTATVTEVALRWGFTHLGRFAQEYRKVYGRPPSGTRTKAVPMYADGPIPHLSPARSTALVGSTALAS